VADDSTAEIIDGNLVIGHDNTAASGKAADGVIATATVTDQNGNPVSGLTVDFTVADGATTTTVKGTTGTEGRVAALVTSQNAGTYTVTAEVNGSSASNDVHFMADSDTAEITDANLSVGTGAVADGKSTNAVSAKVTRTKAGTYAVTASVNGKDISKNTTFMADATGSADLQGKDMGQHAVVSTNDDGQATP